MIHDVEFPTDISYGSSGGPGFSTNIIELDSGAEERISRWSSARRRYDVSYGVKTKDQLSTLISFYIARKGPAIGFLFKDWSDYTTALDHRSAPTKDDFILGVGDGITTDFQLIKKYPSGNVGIPDITRTITRPIDSSVLVADNGTQKTVGTDYTIEAGGIIRFFTAPIGAHNITAGCEFRVPCRFGKAIDTNIPISLDDFDIGNVQSIPVVEIIEEPGLSEEFYYGGSSVFIIKNDITLKATDHRTITIFAGVPSLSVILPPANNNEPGAPWFYITLLGLPIDIKETSTGSSLVNLISGETAIAMLYKLDSTTNIWKVF